MADPVSVFAPASMFVDARLLSVVADRVSGLAGEVAPALRVALVLYVVLYGYAILRGVVSDPVMDFAIRAIKLAFVYAIAVTPAYGGFVTQPLLVEFPRLLASSLGGTPDAASGAACDQLLNYAGYLAARISDQAGVLEAEAWSVAALVYVAGALAAAFGFGVLLIAKVSMALLVMLGPLFVACALFEASRRYFFGWLSQAVNFIVLYGLILAAIALAVGLMEEQWPRIESEDPVVGGLMFVALCLLCAFAFLRMPALAAGIAGGAAAAVGEFTSAAAGAGRAGLASVQWLGARGSATASVRNGALRS